jgi:superfamily II DNA or RNA helicase
MEFDRVITSKGYSIRKGSLTPQQKSHIEKTLEVAPIVNSKFGAQAGLSFRIYKESPQRYYVPRQWGVTEFGEPQANIVTKGSQLSEKGSVFVGKPYDYQTSIINKFIDTGGNGLICVPCGKGKTFMAVAIAAKLGKKFLVVVDKEFLMNQWKNEIESLMPGIRVGIFQRDKQQVGTEVIRGKELSAIELKKLAKDAGLRVGGSKEELLSRLKEANISTEPATESVEYDCTLCMIQTLCGKDISDDMFKDYGFCIFDECHHLGAAHFSKALLKIQTHWMLGLSATPTRDDGLTKVFEWFLGAPVYWEKIREPDPMVIVRRVQVECQDPAYLSLPYDWKHEIVTARLLTQVVDCKPRTQQIAEIVKDLAADSRRRILVLSERIGHLNSIEELLKDGEGKPLWEIGYYVGGMKEEVREAGALTARILLASYAMASEAMNIKTLNTVVLASPRKKVEQSTGRILRIRADQRVVPPLIVDIVDAHGMYQSQWKKRAIYYRKCKYTIQVGDVAEEEAAVEVRAPDENGCLLIDDDE